jgi:tetratricopeptide (TPR) repeat protein
MATTTKPHPHHLSRKELRQPAEFVTLVDSAGDYIANHLGRVISGAIGLLALILVIVGVRFYFSYQDRQIAEAFYQASTAFDRKDYASARSQFMAIAAAHPRSSLGRLATFYLGNAYMVDNAAKPARDAFQKYLAADDRPAFREMALMQLGVADEELADFTGARKAYEDAAALKGPEQGRAELNVARLLARQGAKPAAIAAYQRFLRENPFSQDRGEVIDALAQLGVAPATTSSAAKTIELPAN